MISKLWLKTHDASLYASSLGKSVRSREERKRKGTDKKKKGREVKRNKGKEKGERRKENEGCKKGSVSVRRGEKLKW